MIPSSDGYLLSLLQKKMQTYEVTILMEMTAGMDQYSQYSSKAYTMVIKFETRILLSFQGFGDPCLRGILFENPRFCAMKSHYM